ncbi:GNAT family N-acetyltransferase [Bosea sp. 2RAB26]|uniref:GNAT family N-acetyltransferase n=1 Tax=Bosea sp. 2RAB26 TaxID=3237476 RepID=UPI003F8D9AE1
MTDLIVRSSPFGGIAEVLIEGLVAEYDGRYGANSRPGGARTEILRYPPEAFAPPLGDFLLLRRGDETIAGGAFMSHDDETAELKRIWTRDDLRRQGLARQIVLALEEAAAELGYTRAYLTTGFRQPEATGLYLSLGYRPLFDTTVDPTLYRSLPFEKHIGAKAGTAGSTAIYPPAASLDEATARVAIVKAEQEAKIAARLAAHRAATAQVAAA